MDRTPRPYQFSLANLALAATCLATIFVLFRLYPANPDSLISLGLRNVLIEAIVSGMIMAALGGMLGAASDRFLNGLAVGSITGLIVTIGWAIARTLYWLAASVSS